MAEEIKKDPITGSRMYTVYELADIVGLTYRTLLTYIYDGKLHAVKIGKQWRITEENAKKFLNGEF